MVYEANGCKLETLEPRREAGEEGLECTPLCRDFQYLFLSIDTLCLGRHPLGGCSRNSTSDFPEAWIVGSSTTAHYSTKRVYDLEQIHFGS